MKKLDYCGPNLELFDRPVTVKLSDLSDFLHAYKPFPCSEVWPCLKFDYGDVGNSVTGVCFNVSVSAEHSRVYRSDAGIYKAGQTSFCIRTDFWHYRDGKQFWKDPLSTGFCMADPCTFIDEVKIEVAGVFIISDADRG